jgi:DNA-binding NtrC family response regulator
MNTVQGRILIAEDEHEMAQLLACLLHREGLTPLLAKDGIEALQLVRVGDPDVLLVDFQMPGKNGLEVMRKAKALDQDLPVILLTGFAEVRGAVEAMRAGAHDYLAKPFEHHEVMRVVLRALAERNMRRQLRVLSNQVGQQGSLRGTLGPSEAAAKLASDVQRVAQSNFSVIILGETGSGKEVVARAIHQASLRSPGMPFVPVDCGAIPEALLESELFGHERGAFTGADQPDQPGRFEAAQWGDAVSGRSLVTCRWPSQAKLLARAAGEDPVPAWAATKPVQRGRAACWRPAATTSQASAMDNGSFRRDLVLPVERI